MTLLSFHSSHAIKDKYVARVNAHMEADEIIKGKYWENGKGCAVGCSIHSDDHHAYESELGLPEWLARLEDTLFEGMPNQDAKSFPLAFLEAIPIGVNLERVNRQFCCFLMKENLDRVARLPLEDQLKHTVMAAIQQVLVLHESAAGSAESAESAARSAARSAAGSAARSAESAAWSARSAARSAAGSAARSAESAAWSAAWSAESAAWSAAWSAESAAYQRYADHLLLLLSQSNDQMQ